jgi:hypothetical protein
MLIGIAMICVKIIAEAMDNQRRWIGFIFISLSMSSLLPACNSCIAEIPFTHQICNLLDISTGMGFISLEINLSCKDEYLCPKYNIISHANYIVIKVAREVVSALNGAD